MMILKIDITEELHSGSLFHLELNLINGEIRCEEDGQLKSHIEKFNKDEIEAIIANYVYAWKNEYVDNQVICGKTVKIILVTDREVRHYLFKNSFPEDYREFIIELKKELAIL